MKMKHLRDIMNVKWRDKNTKIEVLKQANLPLIADIQIE